MKQILLILLILVFQFKPATSTISCSQLCSSCVSNSCAQCSPYASSTGQSYCSCQTGYSLNTTSNICFRCDTSCATCSGPQINNCLTCASGFTYNSTVFTCSAPYNSSLTTQQWSYYFDGFLQLTTWSLLNSAGTTVTGTTSANNKTILGGTGIIDSAGSLTVSYTNLPPHYNLRVKLGFYIVNYASGNGSAAVITIDSNSQTVPATDNTYINNTVQIWIDVEIAHSATTATVTITANNVVSFGVREYILIVQQCYITACATCTGPTANDCLTCSLANKFANTTSAGTVGGKCYCLNPYFQEPTYGYCLQPCPTTPTIYYGDPTTTLCVTQCPATYYSNEVTYICSQSCPATSAASQTYYYDTVNRKCVVTCPQTQPFQYSINLTCVSQCPTGYYNDYVSYTCVQYCENSMNSSTPTSIYSLWLYSATSDGVNGSCVSQCPTGFWADPTTISCVTACPSGYLTDNSTLFNRCIQTCPAPDYFGDSQTVPSAPYCTKTCGSSQYGDTSNQICESTCGTILVNSVPTQQYGYVYTNGIRLCVVNCPVGTWAEPTSKTCVTAASSCSPLYADNQTLSCVSAASCSNNYYANPSTHTCQFSCPSSTYLDPTTNICSASCPSPYYADASINLCVSTCFNNTFANPANRQCISACDASTNYKYADVLNKICSVDCSALSGYYADITTGYCLLNCSSGYYADPTTMFCVTTCPTAATTGTVDYYADNSTGTGLCVTICPFTPNMFGSLITGVGICVSTCSGSTPLADQTPVYSSGTRKCVSTCPAGYFAQTATNLCVLVCTTNTYGYNPNSPSNFGSTSGAICQLSAAACPSGFYADDSTNLCVTVCPVSTQGTYADPASSNKCVSTCPILSGVIYYADPATTTCITNCLSPYFGDNNTQTCVTTCLDPNSFADDQAATNTNRLCVKNCSTAPNFYYADNFTKKCVIAMSCSSGFYGENTTQTCVVFCPTNPIAYSYSVLKLCVSQCPGSYYGDTSKTYGVCVLNCPSVPSLFADPTTKLCVSLCPNGYFADSTTRTCVTVCPTGYYSYSPNNLNLCVSSCPSGQFADQWATAPICQTSASSCTGATLGDYYNNSCNTVCTGPTPISLFGYNKVCYLACPNYTTNVLMYAYSVNRSCLLTCPGPGTYGGVSNYYGQNATLTCVQTCSIPNTFADFQNHLCVSICSATPIATYSQKVYKTCVVPTSCPSTPVTFYGDNNTRSCVATCVMNSTLTQYADPNTRTCVAVCPTQSGTYYYGDVSTGIAICVTLCPSVPALFGQKSSNLCVSTCSGGLYGDQTGTRTCVSTCPLYNGVQYFSQDSGWLCVSTCKTATWADSTALHCQVLPTACSNGYFADNSTNTCVQQCPASMNYYGDPTTMFCVPTCPSTYYAELTTRLCVSYCPAGTFGNNATNICDVYCSTPNTYGDEDNSTTYRYCVSSCSQANGNNFADPSSLLCVATCPTNPSYFGNTVNFTCVSTCPSTYYADVLSNRQCVQSCSNGQFAQPSPNVCVAQCSADLNLYGDPNTYTCVAASSCSNGYYSDSTTQLCIQYCNTSLYNKFQYNGACLQFCPTGYYADSNGNCITPSGCNALGKFAQNFTTTCVSTCQQGYADPISYYCIAICPATYYADASSTPVCTQSCSTGLSTVNGNLCVSSCNLNTYNNAGVCSSTCPTGTFADQGSLNCAGSCTLANYYADSTTNRCVKTCPIGYFKGIGSCVSNCSTVGSAYFSDNITGSCVLLCSSGYYGSNYACLTTCPTNFYKYTQSTSGTVTWRACLSVANAITLALTLYVDQVNNVWVATCPTSPLTFGNPSTYLCVGSCPTGTYADPSARTCVSGCTNTSYYADNSTNKCVLACPSNVSYFADPISQLCVLNCQSGYFSDNSTRSCVVTCPSTANTFGYSVNYTCLSKCPSPYFIDRPDRICVTSCASVTATGTYYADSSLGECVLKCNQTYADPGSLTCKSQCADSTLGNIYADNSTNMCVSICPPTPDYYGQNNICLFKCQKISNVQQYADSSTRTCVNTCPGSTYGDPTTNRCVSQCLPNYWADPSTNMCITNTTSCSTGTFKDNSTGLCQASCALASTYADSLTNLCSNVCSGNQFAESGVCKSNCQTGYADATTRTCVSVCPAFNYTYAESSTMTCVASCAAYSKYADNSTQSCVTACTGILYADPVVSKCVVRCSVGYFMQNNTNTCSLSCTGTGGYADPTSQYCIAVCPAVPQMFADIPNLKCVYTCPTNMYADNSTFTCVSQCPSSPNYFSDPVTNNCVLVCSQGYFASTPTRTCTSSCPLGSFADNSTRTCVSLSLCSQTPAPTYSDSTTLKCVRVCPTGYWAQNVTFTCTSICATGTWADNYTKYCVSKCSTNPPQYGYNTTNMCVVTCLSGTYGDSVTSTCVSACSAVGGIQRYADSTSVTCVFVCPSNITIPLYADPLTGLCSSTCSSSSYFRDNSTQTCTSLCPSTPDYYSDSTTGNCVRVCPSGYFAETTTRTCVADCTPYSTFADSITNRCVSKCSTSTYQYSTSSPINLCVSLCPSGQFADNSTQTCVSTCPSFSDQWNGIAFTRLTYSYANSRQCVKVCPSGYFAQNSTQTCVLACSSATQYADPVTGFCVNACSIEPPYYIDASVSHSCVTTCPNSFYKLNTNNTCVSQCPSSYWADTNLLVCVTLCPNGYYALNSTRICVTACASSTLFADPVTRICQTSCTTSPRYYADPYSQTCVQYCPVSQGYYSDNTTGNCVTSCPNGYFQDSRIGQCVSYCQYPLFAYGNSVNTCIQTCPSTWYSISTSRLCSQTCPTGMYSQSITSSCVKVCDTTNNLYADNTTQSCVGSNSCSSSYKYSDNSTRQCVAVCPNQPKYFGDNSTMSCKYACPALSYADSSINMCVAKCSGTTYADPTTNTCVNLCPSGYFSDPITQSCQQVCQIGYYASALTRQCVTQCPSTPIRYYGYQLVCKTSCPSGTFAENTTLTCQSGCTTTGSQGYADSTTNICVSICPLGYYADPTTLKCVLTCPYVIATTTQYLSDPTTRTCVTSCPTLQKLFADYTQSLSCVTSCPNSTFADTSNSSAYVCANNCTNSGTYTLGLNNSCVNECPSPYFANTTTLACVLQCATSYYGSSINQICQACSINCLNCSSDSNCTLCASNYYISFGACSTSCIFNSTVFNYADNSTWSCVNATYCAGNTYGYNDTAQCLSAVNDTTLYANSTTKRWESCPTNCTTCLNSTYCNTCAQYNQFLNNTCNPYCSTTQQYYNVDLTCTATCPDGTYLSSNLLNCQSCNTLCGTCAINATNCLTCAASYMYNGQCINQCPTNYYGDSNYVCQICTSSIPSCNNPVTFTTTTSVVNGSYVLLIKFNQPVTLSTSDLKNILKVKLTSNRLLQGTRLLQDLATLINNGVDYTYVITPEGYLQLTLNIGFTINNPTFTVAFTNPAAVTSKSTGSNLQKLSTPIQLSTLQYFPSTQTSSSTTTLGSNILSIIFAIFFFASLIWSPYSLHLAIEAFQIFFFHSFINYQIPPNLFYFLVNLKPAALLNFLPNILPQTYDGAWSLSIPSVIYNVDSTISFGKTCGSVLLYVVIYIVLAIIIWGLTRCLPNRPIRELCSQLYNSRVKYGFISQVVSVWGLPVFFYAIMQMKHYVGESAAYSFNIFISLLLFLVFITIIVLLFRKIYPNRSNLKEVEDINNYEFLVHGIKIESPSNFINLIYYIRKLLFSILIISAFDNPTAQLILLVLLNMGILITLIVLRPYKQRLANLLHILNEVGIIAFQICLLVYINNMQNAMVQSKLKFGIIQLYIITAHLSILTLWGIFKMYVTYYTVKQTFLESEFYKLYIDDTYEKEIEEGLIEMENSKQGNIQSVDVSNVDDQIVKLRIKRKRKVIKIGSSRNNKDQAEYERVHLDQNYDSKKIKTVAAKQLLNRKSNFKSNSLFDSELQQSLGVTPKIKEQEFEKMQKIDFTKIKPELIIQEETDSNNSQAEKKPQKQNNEYRPISQGSYKSEQQILLQESPKQVMVSTEPKKLSEVEKPLVQRRKLKPISSKSRRSGMDSYFEQPIIEQVQNVKTKDKGNFEIIKFDQEQPQAVQKNPKMQQLWEDASEIKSEQQLIIIQDFEQPQQKVAEHKQPKKLQPKTLDLVEYEQDIINIEEKSQEKIIEEEKSERHYQIMNTVQSEIKQPESQIKIIETEQKLQVVETDRKQSQIGYEDHFNESMHNQEKKQSSEIQYYNNLTEREQQIKIAETQNNQQPQLTHHIIEKSEILQEKPVRSNEIKQVSKKYRRLHTPQHQQQQIIIETQNRLQTQQSHLFQQNQQHQQQQQIQNKKHQQSIANQYNDLHSEHSQMKPAQQHDMSKLQSQNSPTKRINIWEDLENQILQQQPEKEKRDNPISKPKNSGLLLFEDEDDDLVNNEAALQRYIKKEESKPKKLDYLFEDFS